MSSREEWVRQYVGTREGDERCQDCGEQTKVKSYGLDSDECIWPGCRRQIRHISVLNDRPACGEQYLNLQVVLGGYCDRHWQEREQHGLDCHHLPDEVRAFESERRMLFEVEKALVAPAHLA